ncbi:dihydropteroate synthase [Nocardioides zeae]|uniref:dihydropteroate synthase n=1 Tax=Nocardioides imazamoxiresistens TaxID=3231893 RepID=A0ABU3PZM6_9ACTN|nr:dihydropteroate synthase [Nocardioides zeae]MDT9594701.1 dihydropteroate synthase [Nocardioides zeae]
MGVVNVTPDSFSDGGRWAEADAAVRHGLALLEQGADLLDIGGESTRPGATRPLLAEELDRVVPVIRDLTAAGATVSVDTMRAEVAEAALAAGATIVNDVSGGIADPRILDVAAAGGATYVAMHWRAHAAEMQRFAHYPRGVVVEVVDELRVRRDAALAAGVAPERLVLDPGLGFAKHAGQNWELLAGLPQLAALGHRVLVGGSRKTFLGRLLGEGDGLRPVPEREHATAALSLLLADADVWCVRVHDVRATCDALAVRGAWRAAQAGVPAAAQAGVPTDQEEQR